MCGLTRTFGCTKLGLKAVSAEELCRTVESNEELMTELRARLGINSYKEWDGAMPIPEFTPTGPECTDEAEEETADEEA